ncbi:MAG: cytochrome b/b6 domain-containing protein, partial [Nitrospirota bacterium]
MAGSRDTLIYGTTPRLRIYIWEFPVRLTHWVNAFCILILSVTGFYISHPFIYAISSKQYIMGWVRFIHFSTAYVFLMSVMVRVYWAFAGNRFASYKESFPFSAEKFSEFKEDLKFYSFIRKELPHMKVHAVLAGFTYFLVYLIFLF